MRIADDFHCTLSHPLQPRAGAPGLPPRAEVGGNIAMVFKASSASSRRGFTLIEVTISVAIALVLMLGIAEVFRVVGDTVGTGQASANVQRDTRAAQGVMQNDFNSAVSDGAPYMIINAQQQWAFRNQADLLADKDGKPDTYDPTNSGTETAEPAAYYNYRSHRIDQISFFGRGNFTRQTGADAASTNGNSPFVANMGGNEAMLWYGHLNLADNAGSFQTTGSVTGTASSVFGCSQTPGNGSGNLSSPTYFANSGGGNNPNNYFATSWILGRQQVILQPPTSLDNYNNTVSPSAVVDQSNKGRVQYAYLANGLPLSPLAYNSGAYVSSGVSSGSLTLAVENGALATMLSSRIDLAATSLLNYHNGLQSNLTKYPYWWQLLPAGGNAMRFQAQPFFLQTSSGGTAQPKITAEAVALQAPILIRGCTQFTVEYAGDYLNQTTTGATAANQGVIDTYIRKSSGGGYENGSTDGQIDYVLQPVPGSSPTTYARTIRWYGLPRSTSNNTTLNAINGDVCPLRDMFTVASGATASAGFTPVAYSDGSTIPANAPFEQTFPTYQPSDYIGTANTSGNMTSTLTNPATYLCAFGPNDPKPKMIRITITVDDPGGRLGDGQTYEYVYTLP